MRLVYIKNIFLLLALLIFFVQSEAIAQSKPSELNIAITTFTKDPNAKAAADAADLIVEQLNARGGIGGVPVRLRYIDEGVDRDSLIAAFRKAVVEDQIDVTFASITSNSCNALVPIAEELRVLNLMWDCGAPSLLEDRTWRYNFRTQANGTQEMMAMLLYVLKDKPKLKTIAVMNDMSAWGQESWTIFRSALKQLSPSTEIVGEFFIKPGTPDYSAQLAHIEHLRPEVVFTTMAAGNLYRLLRQSAERGLTARSTFVAAVGESAIHAMRKELPEGIIIGARGDHWFLHPEMKDKPEFNAFTEAYHARTGHRPNYLVYHMAQAFSALESGIQAAINRNGGTWPDRESVIDAMKGITFQGWGRKIRIRPEDNQGIEAQLVGKTANVNGYDILLLDDIAIFDGEKLIAPAGSKTMDWIKTLDPEFLKIDGDRYRHGG